LDRQSGGESHDAPPGRVADAFGIDKDGRLDAVVDFEVPHSASAPPRAELKAPGKIIRGVGSITRESLSSVIGPVGDSVVSACRAS
jgi:hypothetical protein